MIERERAHYEVRKLPYGMVYSWRPERTVLECGEVLVWTGPATLRACGMAEADHPWLEEYREWRRQAQTSNVRREYFGFVRAGVAD